MMSKSRFNPAQGSVKPATNAGLILFVREAALPDDWVRLVLAEKEIDNARIEPVERDRPNEDFLTLNPEGDLPTLADREGVISGARVIAEYLDERYPHPPLMPLGPAPRAQIRMHMLRLEMEVFPTLACGRSGRGMTPVALEQLVSAFRSRRLSGGADYTLLDCGWTALFWRLRRSGVSLPQHVAGLQQYAQSLIERANVRRARLT